MPAIVQINFPYTESQSDLKKHSAEAAPRFSGVEGLQWKVWLVDAAAKTAGGIYLFDNRANADAYAGGPLVERLKNARDGVSVKVFDTIDAAGVITNAPV